MKAGVEVSVGGAAVNLGTPVSVDGIAVALGTGMTVGAIVGRVGLIVGYLPVQAVVAVTVATSKTQAF